MKKIKSLICILAVVIAVFGLSQKAKAEEELYITDWLIEADILENGDLKISEDLTFEFNTKFNGVYRDIILNDTSGVTDIIVQEVAAGKSELYKAVDTADNGDSYVYTTKESDDKTLIKIYSPSKDEVKTFRISYIVKNVAVKYNDIGELYYQFLGDENETAIGNFIINIYLPAKASDKQVKVFAHGPLSGKIFRINDKQYQLKVQDVPRNTFIEGRVLFPREFIALSDNNKDLNKYSTIIEEEAAFQNKLDKDKAKKEAFNRNINIINLIVTSFSLLLFMYVLFKCRRNIKNNVYQSNSEIPEDCTPAIAALITSNLTGSNAIFASILDLFRKGYISISGQQDEASVYDNQAFIIYKQKDTDILLLPHERHLMNWLFNQVGHGSFVSTKDIENYSKHNNAKFVQAYSDWKSSVKADADKKGYYDKSKKTYGTLLTILSIVVFIFGLYTAVTGNVISILSISMGLLLMIYGIMLFYRLSDYGYEQYQQCINFKKYIKNQNIDFSQNELLNSLDVSLIYALALNTVVSKQKLYQPDGYFSMNSWIFWYLIFISSDNNSFKKSINSSFAPATDSSSYSGGFSGGGGGGAGGGGAGGF